MKKYKKPSYGGAFDIEDDQFFTREEINEVAYAVEDALNEIAPDTNFRFSEVYIEPGNVLELTMYNTDTEEYQTVTERIDFRKIKKPSDIMKYVAPLMHKVLDAFGMEVDDITSATNTCGIPMNPNMDTDIIEGAEYYDSEVLADPIEVDLEVPLDGIEIIVDSNGDYDFKDTFWVNQIDTELITPYGELNIPYPEDDIPDVLINEIYADFESATDFKPGTYVLHGYATIPYEISNVAMEQYDIDDVAYLTQDAEIRCKGSDIRLYDFGVDTI